MTAHFTATSPGEIEMTMTITMSLADWNKIHNAIANETWACGQFRANIAEMINAARMKFYPATATASKT